MNIKFFFVIDNMSVCKSIVKFVISLTSLIIKVHNHLKKFIFCFYKILDLTNLQFFFKALLEIKKRKWKRNYKMFTI